MIDEHSLISIGDYDKMTMQSGWDAPSRFFIRKLVNSG